VLTGVIIGQKNKKATGVTADGFLVYVVAGEHFERYWQPESLIYETVELGG